MTRELGPESDTEKERSHYNTDGESSSPLADVGTFSSLRLRNFRLLQVGAGGSYSLHPFFCSAYH